MSALGIVEIDLGALERNYERLADEVAPARCGAVVKADAYGLGVGPVATCLAAAGCEDFFVATLDEGIELRSVLSGVKVYVLDGPVGGQAEQLVEHALIPVLNSVAQAELWRDSGAPAALHLDTGMNRLGLGDPELAELLARPGLVSSLDVALLMTHLACGDEPEHPLNAEQLSVFDRMRAQLPEVPTSIGNSAGAYLGAEHRGDLARPGIVLYGGNPYSTQANPSEPVVTVKAQALQIRTLGERTTVGYGATFAARPGARIATLAIGYADGYPRSLGNRGVASVGGVLVPVVGRVSMDLVTIDVSSVPADGIAEGDYVELIGRDVLLDDVAAAAGTIGYELLTSLGPRLRRVYLEGEDE